MQRGFVDCHSHIVPSGDDGVASLDEGAALCREAASRGTRVLFATPHVWPQLPLTDERERAIREAFAQLRPRAELELRLGFELTPAPALLEEDPHRYALDGTDCILVEVPFDGPFDLLLAVAEHFEAAGLQPIVAHPERTEAVLARPHIAAELAARGWLLQVNATSVLGDHGADVKSLAWRLLEEGHASLVASDGHRAARPPYLDAAFTLVERRLGNRATRLFDGSALSALSARAAAA